MHIVIMSFSADKVSTNLSIYSLSIIQLQNAAQHQNNLVKTNSRLIDDNYVPMISFDTNM